MTYLKVTLQKEFFSPLKAPQLQILQCHSQQFFYVAIFCQQRPVNRPPGQCCMLCLIMEHQLQGDLLFGNQTWQQVARSTNKKIAGGCIEKIGMGKICKIFGWPQ